ncbi:uncharacterized protein si:ch73-248e21.5 [Lampris incognitus]|uniref:uncharacterized protein si:ch73-248e21.5 n=1 Tax=Lampris incognitus TaxID=2546036 RepID=UPI0024B4ABCB|nr:uncharacterized protein si:ch73-248e21.5 [Lampris incognitus]
MFHLLFCLPHLLANPGFSLTTKVPLNTAEVVNSPVVKLGASTKPPPSTPFDAQGALAAGLMVPTGMDAQSQHLSGQTGRGVHDSRATSVQMSTVRAQVNKTSRIRGEAVGRGLSHVSTYADTSKVSDSNKTFTTSVYPDAPGLIINKTNNTVTLADKSPKCKEEDSRRSPSALSSSRLICFITLLLLGVTASLFLGLTICLWVRLSVRQEQDRQRSMAQRKSTPGRDPKDLWVAHMSSMEESVEFWYASGSDIGQHATTHNNTAGKGSEREGQGRGEKESRTVKGMEGESLWIQPKVTVKDINDFWYSNGRLTPEEFTQQT